jgi:RHH-type proline utilization regulon transcriptional repressor/proline dehydrogenase/delta 1-pyrroline-5-carboxylate dehydrogenase
MKRLPYEGYDQVEKAIQQHAPELWQELRQGTPGIFDVKYWQGMLMDWVMKDPAFKVDLFHFVDVLPALQSNGQIAEYIKGYLLEQDREVPKVLELSFRLLDNWLTAGIAAATLRRNISSMASNFIVGTNISRAMSSLRRFHRDGYAFTADILGEKTISDRESATYLAQYHELIDSLSHEVAGWQKDAEIAESTPLANISVKISALDSQINAADLEGSVARLKRAILPLLIHARKENVFVNFDLEQWQYHSITYQLFDEVAHAPELQDWPHLGIVVQAYLRSAADDVRFLESVASSRGMPFTVRLVKGAYWDYEVIHARQQGHEPPVWLQKARTDANYEKLSYTLLASKQNLRLAIASHNIRSLLCARHQAEFLGVAPENIELQMLVGMAEPVRELCRARGLGVRLYSPIGELLPGMSYLVRRLLENTSNSGFLRQGFYEEREVAELMQSPFELLEEHVPHEDEKKRTETDFSNVPFLDFVPRETGERFAKAITAIREELPFAVHPGGAGNPTVESSCREAYSPNDPQLLVSRSFEAGIHEAERAVEAAHKAWPAWRDTSLEKRAALLRKLAKLLEADRYRLAALQTVEAGKPWQEADGDVAEAIDFCNYYAHQALQELSCHSQGNISGEDNQVFKQGRGVTAVIAP